MKVEGGVVVWEGLNFESSNHHQQCCHLRHVLVLAQQQGLAAHAAQLMVEAQRWCPPCAQVPPPLAAAPECGYGGRWGGGG